MPFADKLPKPSELVADAYDFAGQLLAAQRKFAEDVIQITAPVVERRGADVGAGGKEDDGRSEVNRRKQVTSRETRQRAEHHARRSGRNRAPRMWLCVSYIRRTEVVL